MERIQESVLEMVQELEKKTDQQQVPKEQPMMVLVQDLVGEEPLTRVSRNQMRYLMTVL